MPTISKIAIKIDGKDFLKVVKVDGAGLFTIQLPLCITEKLGSTYVSGASKMEVDNAFKKAVKDWEAACTVKRKVIVYHVQSTSRIVDDMEKYVAQKRAGENIHGPEGWHVKFQSADIHFCVGTAVAVLAGVFWELKTDNHYRFEPIISNIPPGLYPDEVRGSLQNYKSMDWTQQREDFFAKVGVAMESVILQLSQLKDDTKALNFADNGKFLLTP